MAHIARAGFVHRDLAARNVLIHSIHSKVFKVCDFGLARTKTGCARDRTQGRDEYASRGIGRIPIRWTAPEALTLGIFSEKSDVYSFGMMMVEVYTNGQRPFPQIATLGAVREGAGVVHWARS